VNGKRYAYVVRTVLSPREIPIEGRSSQEREVVPIDLVPPPSPMGVVAFPKDSHVEVDWFPVEVDDLLGYHVYRKGCAEAKFKRLTASPLKETFYIDRPPGGGCYLYAVTAVDASPQRNESPLSKRAKISLE